MWRSCSAPEGNAPGPKRSRRRFVSRSSSSPSQHRLATHKRINTVHLHKVYNIVVSSCIRRQHGIHPLRWVEYFQKYVYLIIFHCSRKLNIDNETSKSACTPKHALFHSFGRSGFRQTRALIKGTQSHTKMLCRRSSLATSVFNLLSCAHFGCVYFLLIIYFTFVNIL